MNHVKRILVFTLLSAFVFTSISVPRASAHVLESNNGVSAILHIKPDDNPIAGKPVPVNFLFSNDKGGFSLNDYKVQLKLVKNDAVKLTSPIKPLFFGAATEGETVITFPEATRYELQAVGTPVEKDAPPFTLIFDVRVADSAASSSKKGNGSMTALLSGVSVIALGLVAVKSIQTGGNYRRNSRSK